MVRAYPWAALPRYGRRDLQLLRKVRRHLGLELQRPFGAWAERCLGFPPDEVSVVPELVGTAWVRRELARMKGAACFALRSRQTEAALVFEPTLVGRLVRAFLRGDEDGPPLGHPTGEMSGLLGYLVAWLLADCCPALDWVVTGTAQPEDVAGSDPFVLRCAVRLSQGGGIAWAIANGEALAGLPECRGRHARPLTRLGDALLQPVIVLARSPILLQDLTDLVAGDVVCLPRGGAPLRQGGRWRASLTCGGGAFAVEVEQSELHIVGPFARRTHAMETDSSAAKLHDTGTLVEQLDVEMVVELGRMQMLAGEVLELSVGDVVTLAKPIGSPVDVRVGGRLLARGELVDVDGETAVRITEVYD